jgi:hypothetical protein
VQERRVPALDAHTHRARRDPIPEPSVDTAFGRVEHRQRFVTVDRLVEQTALDRSEDPAATMRREHRDPAHRGTRKQPATRHRQLEREVPAGPDDLVAIERGQRPVELETRPIELEARGVGRPLTERREIGTRERR